MSDDRPTAQGQEYNNETPSAAPVVTLPDTITYQQTSGPRFPYLFPGLSYTDAPPPTIPVTVQQATEGALDPTKQPDQVAPLHEITAARIAEHADSAVTPNVAPFNAVPQVAPQTSTIPLATRFEYSQALQAGETDGPQDFSERVAGVAASVAQASQPNLPADPGEHASLTNAATALAGALPTHEDLIDSSIAISNQVYGAATPNSVAVIKSNLLDAWTETGQSIPQLVQQAMNDVDLAHKIATPPEVPWQQSPHVPDAIEMAQVMQPKPSVLEEILSRVDPFHGLARGVAEGLSSAISGTPPPKFNGLGDIATRLPESLGFISANSPASLIEKIMSPEFQQRLEVGDVTPQERVDLLSAGMFGVGIKPTGSLGSGVGRILEPNTTLKPEAIAANNIVAQDAIIRDGLGRFFPTVNSAGARKLAMAMRKSIIKETGRANNIGATFVDMMQEFIKSVNAVMPEHRQFQKDMTAFVQAYVHQKQAWIEAGNHPDAFEPQGIKPPTLSQIQHLNDHMEQRPGGGRLAPEHPLFPLAEVLRSAMQTMRADIEKHFDVSSFVENYVAHNYKDPSKFAKAYGMARRGDPSSLNRRTIPYLFDALVRGLEEKFPNPIENALHNVMGMQTFLAAERVIRTGESTGQIVWGRTAPIDGWKKLNGLSRRPVHDDTPAEQLGPQLKIGTDYDRDIEMANKVEGPGAQGRVGNQGLTVDEQGNSVATPAAEAPRPPGGPLQIEAPLGATAETRPLTGFERRRAPDAEYAWAHPSTATIYNNWSGAGFHQFDRAGPIFNALKAATNAATALHLGLTGAHLWDIAQSTIESSMAEAFGEIGRGDVLRGLKDMGMGMVALPRIASDLLAKGKEFQHIYLGKVADLTPAQQMIRQAIIDADARPLGRGAEMAMGQSRNLWTAWRNGGLGERLHDYSDQTPGPATFLGDLRAAAVGGARLFGDVATTFSAPIFDWAVPLLKNASIMRELENKIRQNPEISDAEFANFTHDTLAAKDDIYGELNSEHVFLPRVTKQIASLALLSQSWWYGTVRAFARGANDLLHLRNTSRARWLMAYPVAYTYMSYLYQRMMSGTNTSSFQDLVAPRTGGTTPSMQPGSPPIPQRAGWLTQGKEGFDLYSIGFQVMHSSDPVGTLRDGLINYAMNKGNPASRALAAAMLGFVGSKAAGNWQQQLLEDVAPMIADYGSDMKKGNAIPKWQQWMSFHQAPAAIQDPKGLAHVLNLGDAHQQNTEQWKAYYKDQQSDNPDKTVPKPPTWNRIKRQVK